MSSPARGESQDHRLDIFRKLYCSHPGCGAHAVANGLCAKHEKRLARHGDTSVVKPNGVRCAITVAQGREIRQMRAGFASLAEIARRFDVSTHTVHRILDGKFRYVDEEVADAC